MIKIIDYGLGNVNAFVNVYKRLNVPCSVAKVATDLDGASKIILPGVGAFDHAMKLLNSSGMSGKLERIVDNGDTPLLGVCVGMQILSNKSDEGELAGLGFIPGEIRYFRNAQSEFNLPLPHMGWNDVTPVQDNPLFKGLEESAKFYFLHSFFFTCKVSDACIATSKYGIPFSCAVASKNVYGVQFHPEKSHHYGLLLLKNFAEL